MALTARVTNMNGQVVAEKRNGQHRVVTADPLGSVIDVRDTSATQLASYNFWPYGEIRTSTGSISNPWRFCGSWGYYYDGDDYYVRARTYRPTIGRWLTVDPLWPNEIVFAYPSSPLSLVDPGGAQAEGVFINHYCSGPGVECCDPLPPGANCRLPYFERRKQACEECRKKEGFSSLTEYCNELKRFDKRRPKFPGLSAFPCLRKNEQACVKEAEGRCHAVKGKKYWDKCLHCVASCCLATRCGAPATEYIGWCRERSQLTDCDEKTRYENEDQNANLIGIRGRPDCVKACRRFGATK